VCMSDSRRQLTEQRFPDGLQGIDEIDAHGDEMAERMILKKAGALQEAKVRQSAQRQGKACPPTKRNMACECNFHHVMKLKETEKTCVVKY